MSRAGYIRGYAGRGDYSGDEYPPYREPATYSWQVGSMHSAEMLSCLKLY